MAAPFLNNYRKFFKVTLLLLVLGSPVWMWLAWLSSPTKKLTIAIIDKTVLTQKVQAHRSLNWVLNYEKFTKNKTELYQPQRDYFGFFPSVNGKYIVRGLERFNKSQLEQLSDDAQAIYLADAYGIYKKDWYANTSAMPQEGMLYGGMSEEDLYFLQQMKAKHKLIITEFNCLGAPTSSMIRNQFEHSFGMQWTGWIGRYFTSLDTTENKDIPRWLIKSYKEQHHNKWPFTKSGIVFIKDGDNVVVLEKDKELIDELPRIKAGPEGQQHYGLPASIKYSFWFDVIKIDSSFNHTIASFSIDANAKGKQLLQQAGIPPPFPAITVHRNNDYRFFYFSADFSDSPVSLVSSHFRGMPYIDFIMYNTADPEERESFFWKAYRPLLTRILNDYYNNN